MIAVVELTHRSAPPPEVIMRTNTSRSGARSAFQTKRIRLFRRISFPPYHGEKEWHLAHEVRFGTIWDIPLARTESWRLPGKWQLELAYKVSQEEGRGTDQGWPRASIGEPLYAKF